MNKLILILTVAFIFASCKKNKLNPIPQTDLPESEAFSTAARAEQQAVGMYIWAKGSYFLGSRFFTYNDVRGEEFLNRTANGVTGLQTWNFTVGAATNEVQYAWRDIYQCINQCNFVLEGIDKAPITATAKNEYKGEARFLRGFIYFQMVKRFGGVPLITKVQSLTDPKEELYPARNKEAEVYDFIG